MARNEILEKIELLTWSMKEAQNRMNEITEINTKTEKIYNHYIKIINESKIKINEYKKLLQSI